jgi:hypothetical protein
VEWIYLAQDMVQWWAVYIVGKETTRKKHWFASSFISLVRLTAFVKHKALGDDQSLQLEWSLSSFHSQSMQTGQACCPVIKYTTHNSPQTWKCFNFKSFRYWLLHHICISAEQRRLLHILM